MRILLNTVALCAALLLGACVSAPQQPIQLAQDTISAQSGRIGVAMTKVPDVDTHLPGAGCLLCMAAASAANSALTDYAKTLSHEDLPRLKDDVAQLLTKRGTNAIVIAETLDLDGLSNSSSEGSNVAKKDFTPLQKKYGVDRLLVINVTALGFERTYSAYIPTSEPKGLFRGTGYIVNLKNNTYEWYMPVQVLKSADKQWDEAPKFPGLTNAYYQALELGKDQFLKPFGQP
jgi:hypothetical protein